MSVPFRWNKKERKKNTTTLPCETVWQSAFNVRKSKFEIKRDNKNNRKQKKKIQREKCTKPIIIH